MNLVSALVSSLIQVILALILPILFYFLKYKKEMKFSEFLGITKTTGKAIGLGVLLGLAYFAISWIAYSQLGMMNILTSSNLIGSSIKENGFTTSAVSLVLINSFITTAMSEEIFFRGFLAKRFIKLLGFNYGNLLQSLLFGLMHALLFWGKASIGASVLFILLTGSVGYVMCLVNEKYGKGSIAPSWFAHSIVNTMTMLFFV